MKSTWRRLLDNVPATRSENVVPFKRQSFDDLADEIGKGISVVVTWQAARHDLEIMYLRERDEIEAALAAAEQDLSDKRKAWDVMTNQHGVRGVLPAAVVRVEN